MSNFSTLYRHFFSLIALTCIGLLMNSLSQASSDLVTVVIGDIEGQISRLESFIENSGAFERLENGKVRIKPGYRVVFMGDAVDKAPHSLKILRILTSLLENQPEQMIAILGNRDINKLRLLNELPSENIQKGAEPQSSTMPFKLWLTKMGLTENWSDKVTVKARWIFERTMGAPRAFEFRRQELETDFQRPFSDFDVVQSFLSDFDPNDGIMSRYLRKAQLAFIDKDNRTLFVHGGLRTEAFGIVPGLNQQFNNIDEWVLRLNAWAQAQINEGINLKNGAPELVQYQQPIAGTRANNASIVYGRNFDASANPELIPEELQEELLRQGIDTLIVGHTPVGEIPLILTNGKFRIVFVDNSTSREQVTALVKMRHQELSIRGQSPQPAFIDKIEYQHKIGDQTPLGQIRDGHVVMAVNREGHTLGFRVNVENNFAIEYKIFKSGLNSQSCINQLNQPK